MIDLAALEKEASSDDGPSAVVSRDWLEQVLDELRSGRAAEARLARLHPDEGVGG